MFTIETTVADVFISYSKLDVAIAEALADDLKIAGFDVWWDSRLYAGDNFHDTIRLEIAASKAVVVIWSDTAAKSNWVRGEALEADDQGKLVSTFAPGFDIKKVPLNFRAIHSEFVGSLANIVAAIEKKGASSKWSVVTAPDSDVDLRKRVLRGDAAAQVDVGYKLDTGSDGFAKDERLASRLYRLAAEQGNDWGQVNLAVQYREGLGGLNVDLREAARLFWLAADQNNARGQSCLGFFYKRGLGGLTKDEVEAARLFKLAADQDDYWGQFNLGCLYEHGSGGLPKDLSKAQKYYQLAADQQHEDAKIALQRLRDD